MNPSVNLVTESELIHVEWVQELPEDLDVCIAQRDFEGAVDLIQKSKYSSNEHIWLLSHSTYLFTYFYLSICGLLIYDSFKKIIYLELFSSKVCTCFLKSSLLLCVLVTDYLDNCPKHSSVREYR